ncbi:MAG TPA: hypothetical protein DCY71_09940 [Clostridiaceae bacterium]|jgi:hypothetical protein|nr:hypothetical protein [Clostridiaceae bacterium]
MVKVVNEFGDLTAVVKYNNDLDFCNGGNFNCGSTGCHLGITKLKDGKYVLIHGTDWEGERDYAEIATDAEALDAIVTTGHTELLEKKKFEPLKKLYEEKYSNQEIEEDD